MNQSSSCVSLDLSGILMTKKSLEYLGNALKEKEAKSLILDHCRIYAKDLDFFVSCLCESKLKNISLQYNVLNWEAGPILSQLLQKNKHLISLNLQGNRLEVSHRNLNLEWYCGFGEWPFKKQNASHIDLAKQSFGFSMPFFPL